MAEKRDTVWPTLTRAWAAKIVLTLAGEPAHFNALRRALDGVPASTLSTRLGELDRDGLVRRTASGGRPERVHYELTRRGAALAEQLGVLVELDDEAP